tara:strand:- start:264 stop:635 length:372 start_codon:yes stop_codon:yes gene_type:complete
MSSTVVSVPVSVDGVVINFNYIPNSGKLIEKSKLETKIWLRLLEEVVRVNDKIDAPVLDLWVRTPTLWFFREENDIVFYPGFEQSYRSDPFDPWELIRTDGIYIYNWNVTGSIVVVSDDDISV